MSRVDMSPQAVTERLRAMSRLCDLRPENRLATKVDMSSGAVTHRLRQQSRLRDLALAWQRIGAANGLGTSGKSRTPEAHGRNDAAIGFKA